MRGFIVFIILALLLIPGAHATDTPKDEADDSTSRIEFADFDTKQRTAEGEGWQFEKYEGEYGLWRARFIANGEELLDVGGGISHASAIGFYRWQRPGKDLLLISWYAGGAHGPTHLDIVDLRNDYRILRKTSGQDSMFSLRYIEDLDNDGMPEAIGASNAFEYFYEFPVGFSYANCPFPPIVFSYDTKQRRYVCANHLFSQEVWRGRRKAEKRFKEFLHENWPELEQIPSDMVLNPVLVSEYGFPILIEWVVYLCYEGKEKEALEVVDKYTDPVLAVFTKHAIQQTLWKDNLYRQIKQEK